MRELTLVLFGLVLASPLVAFPGTGAVSFQLPVVLALAAGLLGLAFVRSSRGGDRPPGPAPLCTAGFLLLGAHLISLPGARSLAEAVPPLLILAAGLAVLSCLRSGLLRKERAALLLPVVSGVAVLVSAIGFFQYCTKTEAVSTEGNRNYAGALAAMLLPPAVAFTRRGKAWERGLSGIAAFGLIFLLLVSESRGGFLAALGGLALAAWALRTGKVVRGGLVAAGALGILALAFGASQGRNQVSESRLETAAFRIEAWKSGLRMLARRPVAGWGAGAFSVEYPPFRSEEEFHISHKDVKEGFKEVEDPHSTWVATAVETGALGFLSLLLVAYVAARLWRYDVRHASDPDSAAALAGLGGGAAAFLIAGGFNTLTMHVSHSILFWAFLGLIEVFGETREWRHSSRSREVRAGAPAAAAVVLLFGVLWTVRIAASDRAFTAGMQAQDLQSTEALLREAVDDYPQSWRARFELGRLLSFAGRFAGAAEEARETLKLRPYHVEALNLAATSILRAGGDSYEAERLLRQAIGIAPYYYKSYFNLALIDGQRGQAGESRCHLTKAIEQKPDHAASYYYRGLAALIQGEAESALPDFRMARGLRFDVAGALKSDRPAALDDPRLSELFK